MDSINNSAWLLVDQLGASFSDVFTLATYSGLEHAWLPAFEAQYNIKPILSPQVVM